MSLSPMMLSSVSSESFENTSDQIKHLTPVCRAAKNKKLLRLLQQRMTGNKSANFLGTKIQVYHRIAKRKKFNKLAVCLMNRELYNSIRDLGCHTWVTGIQYGMIRELRRIHGRRILSSRCLENLEDIPTEILLCMIWKQLQLIPVTRKATEEKLQQIIRCYMSLIWGVSIRKGLQTIQMMQRKKQEQQTDEKVKNSILSGSVNWKWRILQQSNKLLSKFLLKNNIKNGLKGSASQLILHPSLESYTLSNEGRNIQHTELTPSSYGGETTDAIKTKMVQDYNQVISEMKIKHASKQCLVGNKKDQDHHVLITSKPLKNDTVKLDATQIEPNTNDTLFLPQDQSSGDQSSVHQIWSLQRNESLRLVKPVNNRQNIPCGELKGIKPQNASFQFHFQNQTCGDQKNVDSSKIRISLSQTGDQSKKEPLQTEKNRHIFTGEVQNTLTKEPRYFQSYFPNRSHVRDKNDFNQFTLPTKQNRSNSDNNWNFSTERVEANTIKENLIVKTKDLCSEKLSQYMRELNSPDKMISHEARAYCKRLLLSKFEDDLSKINAIHAEKKSSSFTTQTTDGVENNGYVNQCHYSPEDVLPKFLLERELQSSERSEFDNKRKIRQFFPPGKVKQSVGESLTGSFHPTSCCPKAGSKVETAKTFVCRRNIFCEKSENGSAIEPVYERIKTENDIISDRHFIRDNLGKSQEVMDENQRNDDVPSYQYCNFDSKSINEKDTEYEETLRDLQKSISVHDVELRKLRFLNYVIDTNWQYFSPKRRKDADVIIDPDFKGSRLFETSFSGLPVDQVRSKIWRKILKEEENYLAETPCRDSQDVAGEKIKEKEKRKRPDRVDIDSCRIEDSVQDFTKQFQNLSLKDTLKINSSIETAQEIEQERRKVMKSNHASGLPENLTKPLEKSKEIGNVLITDRRDETGPNLSQSNSSCYDKNVTNLKQNEFYTEQKLKSLKAQDSLKILEKAKNIERYVTKAPMKIVQDDTSSVQKRHKKLENSSRGHTLKEEKVRAVVKKNLIRALKKNAKVTNRVDKRISKISNPKTEKEKFSWVTKTGLDKRQSIKLSFTDRREKSRKVKSNFRMQTKEDDKSGLDNDEDKTYGERKPLNDKNRMLREKKTQVIYNNNNFVTKSHYDLLDARKDSYHKIHAQLKNISLAHGDTKKPVKAEIKLTETNFLENNFLRHRLQEKHLNDKLNSLETRLKKVNQLNKLLAQINNSPKKESIQKHLEVKNINFEGNEQLDLCHLMLRKRKHLKKYLKLVNDFLVQLITSETKKRQVMQEDFVRKSLKETRSSGVFRSNSGRHSSKPRTRLSRSETVNATYYIENQTVIAHRRSTSRNYANKYKRVSAPSLPLQSHAKDAKLLGKTKTSHNKSKVPALKKPDSYWLIILVAVALLLYHSMSLISLLQSGNNTYNRSFRYK